MTYLHLIERLFQVNLHGGVKLGLQNAQQLQSLLEFPDRHYSSIHVAGTNGKGSVATKIALTLSLNGYRVGLYTSPHLSCFRERIRINGEMISEKAVEKHLKAIFDLCEQQNIPATFFEITTFLAFQYFAEQNIDVAVFETGLGGRLDATNVISPILSVITSISLDHTDILGPNLESITKEKAGIIKPLTPVVIGPKVPKKIIQEIATTKQSPCIIVQENCPTFEEENCQIAKASIEQLKNHFTLTKDSIEKALQQGRQPCRLEIVKNHPFVILDVAHNPDGLTHLFQALASYAPKKPIRILFGLSKNKDIVACLQIICAHGHHFHLVEAPNGRGASVEELSQKMKIQGIVDNQVSCHSNIDDAVNQALAFAHKNQELLIICGSFFIMAEVRKTLGFSDAQDVMDLNEQGSKKIN